MYKDHLTQALKELEREHATTAEKIKSLRKLIAGEALVQSVAKNRKWSKAKREEASARMVDIWAKRKKAKARKAK